MSRGQRPRTPDEFPRMKHRAAGRQMRARRRVLEHFLAAGGTPSVFDAMDRLLRRFVSEVAQPIVDSVREAFLGKARRSDYALVPAPADSVHTGSVGIDIGGMTAPVMRSSIERQRELWEQWRAAHPESPLVARPRTDEVWHDPTHGAIDREIQEAVAESFPDVSLATRVAIEHTAQDRKDRGLSW